MASIGRGVVGRKRNWYGKRARVLGSWRDCVRLEGTSDRLLLVTAGIEVGEGTRGPCCDRRGEG